MSPFSVAFLYFEWHYTRAFHDIFHVFKNFMWFLYNFFSIPLLLKGLFSPLWRLGERYKKGFDVPGLAGTFIVNSIMRVVGALVRLMVVGFGLVTMVVASMTFIGIFIAWILLPFIILGLILKGLLYLI